MKKTMYVIGFCIISISAKAQQHRKIEYDNYEWSIIRNDTMLLGKIGRLNQLIRDEDDIPKKRDMQAKRDGYCHDLKLNISDLNQYGSDKGTKIKDLNYEVVKTLKEAGLDLK